MTSTVPLPGGAVAVIRVSESENRCGPRRPGAPDTGWRGAGRARGGRHGSFGINEKGRPVTRVSPGVFAYLVRSSLHMTSLLVGLLLGIVMGAVIGYLYARGRLADASARADAAEERAALVDGHLAERFEALSAQALDASTARFLEVAEGRLR